MTKHFADEPSQFFPCSFYLLLLERTKVRQHPSKDGQSRRWLLIQLEEDGPRLALKVIERAHGGSVCHRYARWKEVRKVSVERN